MPDKPLVSIGIPTYNRASTLRRAIESALTQDYQNIELIISDNASTDETPQVCAEVCAQDRRVKYIRQPRSLGGIANFREVLAQSRGEFFMWLGDDDWLERSYVAACCGFLMTNPDYVLASGRAKFFSGAQIMFEERGIDLPQSSGPVRVLAYYDQVVSNGTFYGVMRRERLEHIPIYETVGGDWFFTADVAFTGKFKALNHVAINRSLAGTSRDVASLAHYFGLHGFVARNPHVKIAISAWKNILSWSPVYVNLSRPARLLLGFRVFTRIWRRYTLAGSYRRLLARVNQSHPRFKRAAKLVKNKFMTTSQHS